MKMKNEEEVEGRSKRSVAFTFFKGERGEMRT